MKRFKSNHESRYNKHFRKAIMKTIRFQNEAKRSKYPVDIGNYKNQRKLVVFFNVKQSLDISMKYQVLKAQHLSRIFAYRTFQIIIFVEILNL